MSDWSQNIGVGLIGNANISSLKQYLNLTPEALNVSTSNYLAGVLIALSQYKLYLTGEIGTIKAQIGWKQHGIKCGGDRDKLMQDIASLNYKLTMIANIPFALQDKINIVAKIYEIRSNQCR